MRVVVVGAGIIGACVARAAIVAGCDVVVLDRDQAGSGTTSRGEGNVLVSDKPPGPELDLALRSRRRWDDLGDELGREALELESKGGLVVATSVPVLGTLARFADEQRRCGVIVEDVARPVEVEPLITPGAVGGQWYPQDAQVQPVLATVAVLADAARRGAEYRPGTDVLSARSDTRGAIKGVVTTSGEVIDADAVVNCAGTWGGEVGRRLGGPVPVLPRKGFVLVTEPLPPSVRHKVYSADYVANVAASSEGLETSCVVEATRAGTILIGASRERVGFDASMSPSTVQRLAAQAVALFPFLAGVQLLRVYRGFRPYCPDHQPVIGPDPRVPGLFHACGHEGAGIGLAPATGDLIAAHLTGRDPLAVAGVDPAPFLPERLLGTDMEAS
ncbi:NAD(P)/FAD-dependent oxidoreductase [Knoellia sp. CPCC 206453]|uniref:NAD(P)/FAD-dependent oxidoreductase n=1 Tax=Knoellia pratensis TaxID=3404796 RepID=UPI00361F39E2